MYIYYNDKLMKEACVKPTSQGFQYGYGVFETILVKSGLPCFLDMHYKRLIEACSGLGLELRLDIDAINTQAVKLAQACNITDGRLKIICFKDVETDAVLMTLSHYSPENEHMQKGISLGTSSIMRNPHSPMTYIKSLNYTENILAKAQVKSKGYDEALFLNIYSNLCEGSASNVFWIKQSVLYTPDLSCGLLNGITRRQVLDVCRNLGLGYKEGSYDLTELLSSEEVFITNSLMGIMPVCRVDNTIYNLSGYKITGILQAEYAKLVNTQISVSHGL